MPREAFNEREQRYYIYVYGQWMERFETGLSQPAPGVTREYAASVKAANAVLQAREKGYPEGF